MPSCVKWKEKSEAGKRQKHLSPGGNITAFKPLSNGLNMRRKVLSGALKAFSHLCGLQIFYDLGLFLYLMIRCVDNCTGLQVHIPMNQIMSMND